MTHEGNTVLKSGIWYTVCNFLVKGVSFLTTPIFTRLLSQEDVGAFSNIMSWISILTIVSTFDLFNSVNLARFDYKDQLDDYITSILILGSIITTSFFAVIFVFQNTVVDLLNIDKQILLMIFIYCLVYPAMQMFQLKSRIFYKYKSSVSITLISVISSVISSLIAVLLCNNKLYGRTYGFYIPLIILNIIIYSYFLFKSKRIKVSFWGYALAISFPLIWHTLAGELLSSSDRIMITHFCGKEDNALYSIGYSCALIVSVLWASMNTAWSPWAYEQMDKRNYQALRKASKPYMLFFGFVVFAFLLLAPEVVLVMGGKSYNNSLDVIPPVMVGYVFQFAYSIYVNIEFYHKKQRNIAIGTIIAALINIILNALLIPIYGYVAAAYTTLVGYIVLFCIHFLFVKKLEKLYWYDTKFNTLFLAFFVALLPFSFLIYRLSILRMIIIALIGLFVLLVMIIKRRDILLAIKNKNISHLLFKAHDQ